MKSPLLKLLVMVSLVLITLCVNNQHRLYNEVLTPPISIYEMEFLKPKVQKQNQQVQVVKEQKQQEIVVKQQENNVESVISKQEFNSKKIGNEHIYPIIPLIGPIPGQQQFNPTKINDEHIHPSGPIPGQQEFNPNQFEFKNKIHKNKRWHHHAKKQHRFKHNKMNLKMENLRRNKAYDDKSWDDREIQKAQLKKSRQSLFYVLLIAGIGIAFLFGMVIGTHVNSQNRRHVNNKQIQRRKCQKRGCKSLRDEKKNKNRFDEEICEEKCQEQKKNVNQMREIHQHKPIQIIRHSPFYNPRTAIPIGKPINTDPINQSFASDYPQL